MKLFCSSIRVLRFLFFGQWKFELVGLSILYFLLVSSLN